MAKKTVQIKSAPKPRSADEFVAAGREPAAVVTSERMKRLTLDVPLSLHRRIKRTCADRGKPMAGALRQILEREFPNG